MPKVCETTRKHGVWLLRDALDAGDSHDVLSLARFDQGQYFNTSKNILCSGSELFGGDGGIP